MRKRVILYHLGRRYEFEGGEGVSALEGEGEVNTVKALTLKKGGVHDPPPSYWHSDGL